MSRVVMLHLKINSIDLHISSDSYIAVFRSITRYELTVKGISSIGAWGTTSDRWSSAFLLIRCPLDCSERSWRFLFCHPMYQRGCNEPGPHCLPPHLSPAGKINWRRSEGSKRRFTVAFSHPVKCINED